MKRDYDFEELEHKLGFDPKQMDENPLGVKKGAHAVIIEKNTLT